MPKFRVEVITPRSTDSDKDRVYRLRHAVYCKEMKLPLAAANSRLFDEYDEFSNSLLLSCEGIDVGTIRWTPAGQTQLEIEKQCPQWHNLISKNSGDDYSCTFEINRFMVARDFRGTGAGLTLINQMRRNALSQGYHLGYFAGKTGSLARYYLRFGGSSVVDPMLRPYTLDDEILGYYCLLLVNFGRKHSFRQAAVTSNYAILEALRSNVFPVYKFLMRQKNGYTCNKVEQSESQQVT